MYLFAHVFSGALVGLVFWYLVRDRRVLPVCIFGAILPDLLDKPIAVLFPGILGASRTIGHSLLFVTVICIAGLILWHERHTLLGLAFAFSVLSHQVLDAMWGLPGTWFFPLMGPFPVIIIPDYVRHSLWLELSSPSELVFAVASVIIMTAWYPEIVAGYLPSLTEGTKNLIRVITACILGGMGACLLVSGLNMVPESFFAPAYAPVTRVMAGLLSLCGAIILEYLQSLRCLKDGKG